MLTLTEFLLARIAEDEAAARKATPGPWRVGAEGSEGSRVNPRTGDKREDSRWIASVNGRVQPEDGYNAAHIARHDPTRVLAECEAKRRIVEDYAHLSEASRGPLTRGALRAHAEFVVQVLALPYAEHPDYLSEWRP